MNTEALHLFNRCFSVCMDCAMSQHQTYSVDPASSVSVFDPDEPGALERQVLPFRQAEFTLRMDKIQLDFADKCFTTGAAAGGKCRPPGLRTVPHLTAWWLPRLRTRVRTLERRLSSMDARRGLRSPPPAAPKLRIPARTIFRHNPTLWWSAARPGRHSLGQSRRCDPRFPETHGRRDTRAVRRSHHRAA
jgi:hypothetical protein